MQSTRSNFLTIVVFVYSRAFLTFHAFCRLSRLNEHVRIYRCSLSSALEPCQASSWAWSKNFRTIKVPKRTCLCLVYKFIAPKMSQCHWISSFMARRQGNWLRQMWLWQVSRRSYQDVVLLEETRFMFDIFYLYLYFSSYRVTHIGLRTAIVRRDITTHWRIWTAQSQTEQNLFTWKIDPAYGEVFWILHHKEWSKEVLEPVWALWECIGNWKCFSIHWGEGCAWVCLYWWIAFNHSSSTLGYLTLIQFAGFLSWRWQWEALLGGRCSSEHPPPSSVGTDRSTPVSSQFRCPSRSSWQCYRWR